MSKFYVVTKYVIQNLTEVQTKKTNSTLLNSTPQLIHFHVQCVFCVFRVTAVNQNEFILGHIHILCT